VEAAQGCEHAALSLTRRGRGDAHFGKNLKKKKESENRDTRCCSSRIHNAKRCDKETKGKQKRDRGGLGLRDGKRG